MSNTRADRAEAREEWADRVGAADLRIADTEMLRTIGELVDQRNGVEQELNCSGPFGTSGPS